MDNLVSLGEHLRRRDISSSDFVNAESLISITDDVKIFNITPDGSVCSPSDSLPVHIIRLKDEPQIQSALDKSPTFLHVGDWLYPLIPGVSPVLLSNYGAFIFPDLMTPDRESFVALMFPESLPSELRQLFEDLLRSLALLSVQRHRHDTSIDSSNADTKTQATLPQKHMKELSKAADKLTQELFGAVVWIADEVEKGTDKVKEKVMEEAKKLHQEHKATVEPMVREGVIYAQEVADSAVKVSGYVVHKLGDITAALGRDLASHPKDRLRTSNVDEAGGSTGDPVYAALDEAALILERCLANGQEHVTTYKYGENPV
ncbi:hypothetical protein BsWGS_17940 [Bradybaena similaris]